MIANQGITRNLFNSKPQIGNMKIYSNHLFHFTLIKNNKFYKIVKKKQVFPAKDEILRKRNRGY